MLINITGEGDDRTLTVKEHSGEVVFEADGLKLSEAHKLAKTGLKDGWDKLTTAEPAKGKK